MPISREICSALLTLFCVGCGDGERIVSIEVGIGGRTSLGGASSSQATGLAGLATTAGVSGIGVGTAINAPSFDVDALPEFGSSFLRGVNLGNRLDAPNEGDWGPVTRVGDFAAIAARGFDHVRLPVRFSGHALASTPYTLESDFLVRVDWAIEQALTHRLSVLLVFQYYDDLMSKPEAHRDRFLGLWEQIARRYQAMPKTLGFELLGEPNGNLDAVWNDVVTQAVERIRNTNHDRTIVVNSPKWADPGALSDLMLPNDSNLVAGVHFYDPRLFTMQGASWLGPEYGTTGVVFPGPPPTTIAPVPAALAIEWTKAWFRGYNQLSSEQNPAGARVIEEQVAKLMGFRVASGRPVYVGEFGATIHCPEESRFRLFKLLRESCDAAGIGWAVWDDNGGQMSVLGDTTGTWRDSTIDALIPLAP